MPVRTADAEWTGTVKEGQGKLNVESGVLQSPYSFQSRTAQGTGTNPEELIGAAHAGCFSMALSALLTEDGIRPGRIHTTAKVHLEKSEGGFSIPRIELITEGEIPGIDAAAFKEYAEMAKKNCPVSRALAGVQISLEARLLAPAGAS